MVEGADLAEEGWVYASPAVVIELVGEEFHFDEGFAFGMEVTAGITAQIFDLVIDAFREVGGAQVGMDGAGVF